MINRLFVLISLVLLGACVAPSMTETTPPTVAFFNPAPPNNQITTLSIDPTSTTPVSFLYVASDPGGVQSLALSFATTAPPSAYALCATVSGCPCTTALEGKCVTTCTVQADGGYGTFGWPYPYMPVLNPPTTITSSISEGTVPSFLLGSYTLNGPFTCTNWGESVCISSPYGQTINATATATNYSSYAPPGSGVLPITFTPWVSKGLPCTS